MKERKKRLSRKEVIIRECVACFLGVCGFACIVLATIMQDKGGASFPQPGICFAGFIVLDILAVMVLTGVLSEETNYEIDDKNRKYSKVEMTVLSNLDRKTVTDRFLSHGFRPTDDGYLRKKAFTFAKDFICYLVKITDTADVGRTIQSERQRVEMRSEKPANSCLLLFAVKDGVEQADIELVRNAAKAYIIAKTVVPVRQFNSCVIVLVDSQTKKGQFLAIKGASISDYKHGCRLLMKYFS